MTKTKAALNAYLAAKSALDLADSNLPVVPDDAPIVCPEQDAWSAAWEATCRPLQDALRVAELALVDAIAGKMARSTFDRALIAKARSGMWRADLREKMIDLAIAYA